MVAVSMCIFIAVRARKQGARNVQERRIEICGSQVWLKGNHTEDLHKSRCIEEYTIALGHEHEKIGSTRVNGYVTLMLC